MPTSSGSSSLSGTVLDSGGLVVPQSAVTIVNESTGLDRVGVTNDAGEFVFPALPPGVYTVKVKAPGFRPYERSGITLTSSARLE